MEATYFATAALWRAWLEASAADATEIYVGFHKRGTGVPSITWAEAVDEALCFGWIDGVRQRVDEGRYRIRFTPRRAASTWSAVNIRRVGELAAAGRMTAAGTAAFAARREDRSRTYAYEQGGPALSAEHEAVLRADSAAWAFWEAQPPSYRRTASWWVVSAKREETRERRLATLVADSAAHRRIAQLRRAGA